MTVHPLLSLKPREGRRARTGAPWIFANELVLDAKTKALAPGTLVRVQSTDKKDVRDFGLGYFNPKSLIAVRLFETAGEDKIDTLFFQKRLARALALRDAIYPAPFYRLVHAEGDGLPGLTIDRFGDTCVVQVTTAGMEALLDPLQAALDIVVAPKAVILRNDTPSRALEGLESYVKGDAGRIAIEENGARYLAEPTSGQKTGWYYDQRDNRAFMASLSRDQRALDLCCYTGGFAIAAAKAGAKRVTAVDSSAPALALAEDAAKANDVAIKTVKADVFEELERMQARGDVFDIVIADPPPFVKSRKDLEAGARAYRKLARMAANVTAKGGFLMLASCSHNIPLERFAQECALGIGRTGRKAALIRQAGAGADHPVHPMLPETAYLKALVYVVN